MSAYTGRGPVLAGIAALLVLFGGFGGWAAFARLDGAIIAAGQIEVEQNRQVVQHPDGGVVAEILVTEGSVVAAGAPLLRLDGAALRSEAAIVEGQYFEILARRGRLEAERDDADAITFPAPLVAEAQAGRPDLVALMEGKRRLFVARRESYAQQADQMGRQHAQIDAQIDGIAAQKSALETQVALIRKELVGQRSLFSRGLAEATRVLSLEREEARLEGSIGSLAASAAEAAAHASEIDIGVLKLASARREDALTLLRDVGPQEMELAERRRSLAEQIDRLEIRAPVAGVVYGLTVTTPRAVIRAADPLLYLVPQDRPLVIAARIEPIHIDEVAVGQPATLTFPAFDRRTTPELFGSVRLISADAFIDQATRASYYRAEITLDPGEVARISGLTLVPGMPVQAFLRTGTHRPIAWLVKPFADYFTKAFRET